ncbi:hypothetical protein Bca101_036091 [Brassica carinata]
MGRSFACLGPDRRFSAASVSPDRFPIACQTCKETCRRRAEAPRQEAISSIEEDEPR